MKPPPFGYSRPETVEEAIANLADRDPDGKVLAGGQSLLPLLNMRLATPEHLVDINRLSELSFVRVADGHVVIGALARHSEVLADQRVARAQPLISQALLATLTGTVTVPSSSPHDCPAPGRSSRSALRAVACDRLRRT